ncbi:MAG: hypothetical protein WA941_11630 [Nitrososphaeraceae archaeon]
MPLEPAVKAILNQSINRQIANISTFVKTCRKPEVKEAFRIKTPEDFVVGAIIGGIIEAFRVAFLANFHRELELDEAIEATALVLIRANDIRDAILGVSN